MKKLVLGFIVIATMMFSEIATAGDVYSCAGGRLQIGALATDFVQSSACHGSNMTTYTCTGGTGMTTATIVNANLCKFKRKDGGARMEEIIAMTTLTKSNFEDKLYEVLPVESVNCAAKTCIAKITGYDGDISKFMSENFNGYKSLSSQSDDRTIELVLGF